MYSEFSLICSKSMFGGADMVVAAIAYFSTNWTIFITAMASIGLFGCAAGVVTVRKAIQPRIVNKKTRSIANDIRRTSKTFFTSSQMIKTTFYMVSSEFKQPNVSQLYLGNHIDNCNDVSIWSVVKCWQPGWKSLCQLRATGLC